MSHELLEEILAWSTERPSWQRDALRRLFANGALTPPDLDDLTDLCKAAHGLSPSRAATVLAEEHLAIGGAAVSDPVTLSSVTHHRGVNALATEQTIAFGPSLTIVYGQNAAGKSGYSRILKRACRSRSPEEILGNVLSGETPFKAQATIRYRVGAAETAFAWAPDVPPAGPLAAISAFDSHCAPVYLSDKTDVAFRPFSLDIFDKLATACADVRKKLEEEFARLKAAPVALPSPPEGSRAKAFLDSLTSLTKAEDVQAMATLSAADEDRLHELRTQDRDFRATDPKRLAADLKLKAQRIEGIASHLDKLATRCGDAALRELKTTSETLVAAREALTVLRKTALTSDLLPGTGEAIWRQLWDAAKAFSSVAYPLAPFPNLSKDARCPLCQQEIGKKTGERLMHFQEYVESGAQAEVTKTEKALTEKLQAATSIAIERDGVRLAINELKADDVALADRADRFLQAASAFQKQVKNNTDKGAALPAKGIGEGPSKDLYSVARSLLDRSARLEKESSGMKPEDRAELVELEGQVAIRDNVTAILTEIERRKRIAAYSQCLDDTATQSVTRKSTELTKRLVTDQLRAGFQTELKALKFIHLAVEIRSAGGAKGALLHHLVFSNAPGVNVSTVLSEGESRALSLAAFLAELGTAGSRSAILFDDPVSSLDHIWRERIADRLVEEAKTRQVIVFTHDLLFLRILMDRSEHESVRCEHQYVRQEAAQAGIVSPDLPWVALGTSKRIGVLRQGWQAAEKLSRKGTTADYEKEAREIYGMLRETWEQAIGEVLLHDVIGRYRPSVESKKVRFLHDITREDCKAVDDGMTECSRWLRGHDQPPADGTPFPGPADLKAQIDTLEDWVKAIRNRRASQRILARNSH